MSAECFLRTAFRIRSRSAGMPVAQVEKKDTAEKKMSIPGKSLESELLQRNSLRKALLLLTGVLFTMGGLELAARIYARITSQQRTIVADPVLGWRLIPNTNHFYRKEEQPYLIQINSKGLRDTEHSYEKPAGTFRVVVIGDSMVFGSGGVNASDRFTDILQKTAKNAEVINMGVPAYGTDQEYLYLKAESLKYHPDLVILCAFANDFVESFSRVNPSIGRPKGYFSLAGGQLVFHPPSFSIFYKLSQHSYLFGLAYTAVAKVSYIRRPHPQELSPPERLATLKQLFIASRDACREQGAEFVLVYLPGYGSKSKDSIEEAMDELAVTQGIRTLDLLDYMKRVNAQRRAYFIHDIHLNEVGHRAVAEALLNYLVANQLLNVAEPAQR